MSIGKRVVVVTTKHKSTWPFLNSGVTVGIIKLGKCLISLPGHLHILMLLAVNVLEKWMNLCAVKDLPSL